MNIKSLLVAAALSLGALSAQATSYTFSQTGFTGGGSISGSFTGVDLNNDGILGSSISEISAFSLSFTGDSQVASFSLGLNDLSGLVFYIQKGNFIGEDGAASTGEGIGAYNTNFSYFSGIGQDLNFTGGNGGQIGDGEFNVFTTTNSLISVTAVPEPASFAMLLAGLGLMGAVAVRRKLM